jgi:O-antigen ligase
VNGLLKELKSSFGPIGWLWTATLVLVILLGGSTKSGFLSDAILQLACLPLLLVAANRIFSAQTPGRLKLAAVAALMLALPPLIQLIPLPPLGALALPTQKAYAETLAMSGAAAHWVPLSLDAKATAMSALGLIPALAIFFGTLLLGRGERRAATLILLGIGLVGVAAGILQVAQGSGSPLRFFEFTNLFEAVGFFANRNHFAALAYVLLLFAAVWAIHATTAGENDKQHWSVRMVPVLGWFTVLVVLLAAQALTRSRAGLGLTIFALLGAFMLAMSIRRSSGGRATSAWMLTAALLGTLMLSGQFVLFRILERFGSDPLGDSRIAYARSTIRAAKAYMPFGSGFGTFVPVYASIEKPDDLIANMFANHAHSDLLEIWLESGFMGPAIALAFVVWLAGMGIRLWRYTPRQVSPLDAALAHAAFFAAVLLSVHSLVDYPLRTSALMSVMAFCCALLIAPPSEEMASGWAAEPKRRSEPAPAPRVEPVVRRSPAGAPPAAGPPMAATPMAPFEPKERALWGAGEEWPQTWTGPAGGDKPRASAKPPPSAVWDKKIPDKNGK